MARTVACSVDLPIYAVYTDYSHSLAHGFTKLTKSESSRSRNVTETFSTSTSLIFGPRYTKANWLDVFHITLVNLFISSVRFQQKINQ